MEDIITTLREELIRLSDPAIKKSSMRYFREEVSLYGLKAATLKELSKIYFRLISDKDKSNIFYLCEELWKSGYLEETFFASDWCYAVRKQFGKDDFFLFERWVEMYINNWASCDTFCNHTMGTMIERYPELIADLKKWAFSTNRWVRRAASVSLIVPARKGLFLDHIFEIADSLIADRDDMVRKGYGWMLKSASIVHTRQVFNFVVARNGIMPRIAYRYAIEKLPDNLRARAMEA